MLLKIYFKLFTCKLSITLLSKSYIENYNIVQKFKFEIYIKNYMKKNSSTRHTKYCFNIILNIRFPQINYSELTSNIIISYLEILFKI